MPHPAVTSLIATLLNNETDHDRVTGLRAIATYLEERTQHKDTLTPEDRRFMDFAMAVKNADIEGTKKYIEHSKVFVSPIMLLACPVDAQEQHSPSPFLFYAARYADNLEDALIYSDSLNEKNFFGRTLLMLAAQRGDIKAVKALLKHNASISATDKHGNSACMLAELSGQIQIVRLLMQHGAGPIRLDAGMPMRQNSPRLLETNAAGDNALHIAAQLDNPTLIQQLVSLGVDIRAENAQDLNPVMVAAKAGKHQSLQALIDAGANIHVKNERKETALMWAAVGGSLETTKLLLDNNADRNATDNSGMSAFLLAARHGNVDILEYFITHYPDSAQYTLSYTTPLIQAATSGNAQAVTLLLPRFDVNDVDFSVNTALTRASSKAVIEVLLKAGANLHAVFTEAEYSVLMIAMRNKQPLEVIRTLLEKGADPYAKNIHGSNAFLVAAKYASADIIQYFITHYPNIVHSTAMDKKTALIYASEYNNIAAVRLLLPFSDVNAKNRDGNTALGVTKKKEIVTLLIKEGAPLERVGALNQTALTRLLSSSYTCQSSAVEGLIFAHAKIHAPASCDLPADYNVFIKNLLP